MYSILLVISWLLSFMGDEPYTPEMLEVSGLGSLPL